MKTLDALLSNINLNRLSTKRNGTKKIRNLHDLLMNQLVDFREFEQQQVKALPRLISNSENMELNAIISEHVQKINSGLGQIKSILEYSGEKSYSGDNRMMDDIIGGVKNVMRKSTDEKSIIQTELYLYIQYINHIGIANYQTLINLANALHYTEITGILEKLLSEKRNIDYRLKRLSVENICHSVAV